MSGPDSSVIVVLGAEVRADGRASPTLQRRIGWGIELFERGEGGWLLVSGGEIGGAPSEAAVMAGLARERGIAAERLVLEARARNTWENARECARIIRARGWRRVVLVTDPFHRPRAVLAFRAFGVTPIACPICRGRAGTSPPVAAYQHLRELVAFGVYLLRVVALKLIGSAGQ